MKQEEKNELLQQLNEKQIELSAKMAQSDAHASKCIKLGLNFAKEYPADFEAYKKAREEYNANEAEIERINNTEVEIEIKEQ